MRRTMLLRLRAPASGTCSAGGFTLIEAVLTIGILSVVGLTASYVITSGMSVQAQAAPRMEASYQARLALEWLRRDIRSLAGPGGITVFTPAAFEFLDLHGNTVSYAFAAGDLSRNGDLLAQGLTTFGFSYRDRHGAPAASALDLRTVEVDFVVQVADQKELGHALVFPRSLGP